MRKSNSIQFISLLLVAIVHFVVFLILLANLSSQSVVNEEWVEIEIVPTGNKVAKLESYNENELYRVSVIFEAGLNEYQYIDVFYGVENYGKCRAVHSEQVIVDLSTCDPGYLNVYYFDPSLQIPEDIRGNYGNPPISQLKSYMDPSWVRNGRLDSGKYIWTWEQDGVIKLEIDISPKDGCVNIGGITFHVVVDEVNNVSILNCYLLTPRLTTEELEGLEITIPLSQVGDGHLEAQVGMWQVEVAKYDVIIFRAPEGYNPMGWGFGSWACYETYEGDGFTTERTFQDGMLTVSLVPCVPNVKLDVFIDVNSSFATERATTKFVPSDTDKVDFANTVETACQNFRARYTSETISDINIKFEVNKPVRLYFTDYPNNVFLVEVGSGQRIVSLNQRYDIYNCGEWYVVFLVPSGK